MSYAPPASPRRSSRVLLVYPPISKQERYSSEIGRRRKPVPLGVFYLAAELRRLGHEAKVIDGEAEDLTAGEIVRTAVAWSATVVGISSTTVAFHRRGTRSGAEGPPFGAADRIGRSPHHVQLPPRDGPRAFDYGVVGEGERTLPELCAALENGGPVADIPASFIAAAKRWPSTRRGN